MSLYKLSKAIISHADEDNIDNGCTGEGTTQFLELDSDFVTDNLKTIIDKINEFCKNSDMGAILVNSCGDAGRIDCQVMTTKPHKFHKLSEKVQKQFLAGERNLYLNDVCFQVETSNDNGISYERLELPHVEGACNQS